MNRIAYFDASIDIYWYGIMIGLALLAGLAVFAVLVSKIRRGAAVFAAWFVVASFPVALLLARAYYCIFRREVLAGSILNLFDITHGGYAVYGAMLGVLIVALFAANISQDMTAETLLDCLAPAGALMIAIGRYAAYLSGENFGIPVENPAFRMFPFSVLSPADGKWHLAVFVYEGTAALLTFAATLAWFSRVYKQGKAVRRPGTVFALFAVLYTATQIPLESMRIDSLFMNSLGFVRISQAVSAIILTAVLMIAFIRAWRLLPGLRTLQIALWVINAAGLGGAFWAEFTMKSEILVRNYSVMWAGMIIMASSAIWALMKTSAVECDFSPDKQLPSEQEIPEDTHDKECAGADEVTEKAGEILPSDEDLTPLSNPNNLYNQFFQ